MIVNNLQNKIFAVAPLAYYVGVNNKCTQNSISKFDTRCLYHLCDVFQPTRTDSMHKTLRRGESNGSGSFPRQIITKKG